MRAQATLELAAALDEDLDRREAGALLRELELPLVSVLAKMEHTGIAADVDHFAAMSAMLHGEAKAAEQAAFAVIGHEFNLGSPKQLQEVLFTELGLPKTKRIKTGYTTDSEALTSLLAQTGHPLLEHLLRHRDVAKLMSIVDSLIPMAGENGRIHTTFNQTIAATGRLSSTDPNLQNIPIRSDLGRRIREGFIVGAGYECLLSADYSQIELRIMAHLSGDEALIAAFESGHDFHAATASRVFSVPPDEVGPEMRAKIKAMNYGLAYGLSAFGLSQQLRISTDEARGLMEEYFAEFGGVRDYLHEVVSRARMDGYTATMMGRRRYLPDLTSDNRQRREMAERMALNAPIQGSAADVIKVAMLAVDSSLAAAGLRSRMLLQVHDELIVEVAPGEFDTARDLVCAAMAGAASLRVPLDVSVGTGRQLGRSRTLIPGGTTPRNPPLRFAPRLRYLAVVSRERRGRWPLARRTMAAAAASAALLAVPGGHPLEHRGQQPAGTANSAERSSAIARPAEGQRPSWPGDTTARTVAGPVAGREAHRGLRGSSPRASTVVPGPARQYRGRIVAGLN